MTRYASVYEDDQHEGSFYKGLLVATPPAIVFWWIIWMLISCVVSASAAEPDAWYLVDVQNNCNRLVDLNTTSRPGLYEADGKGALKIPADWAVWVSSMGGHYKLATSKPNHVVYTDTTRDKDQWFVRGRWCTPSLQFDIAGHMGED